jgi:hypothetical protein
VAASPGTKIQPELTFRVVLQTPPPGVEYAVQVGRGAAYETIRKQRSTGGDLCFEFGVGLSTRRPAAPDFRGPVVQGPRGQRFVYIDIGTFAGQADTCWSRRLKIPLAGITWMMLGEALADAQMVLETRVPGTGRDGSPSCATVKPFDGWKVTPRRDD